MTNREAITEVLHELYGVDICRVTESSIYISSYGADDGSCADHRIDFDAEGNLLAVRDKKDVWRNGETW